MAKHWDRHNQHDRIQFVKFLQPLVTASRAKDFTLAEASVYMLTLQDVSREVLALGVSRLIENGITWMPKPGDIKKACCDIADERRAIAARHAQELQKDCTDCQGSGWRSVMDASGFERVKRCECFALGLKLIADAGEPLARPALPPSNEPEIVG